MTAERHTLHDLVEELPDDQVAPALADLRRRLPQPTPKRSWPPKFFGGGIDKDNRTDLSENVDDHLSQGFGQPRS